MAKRWGGEGEKEREEMEETRLGILVDLKEDQYLDSGVWGRLLGLDFSLGLIKKVFEIVDAGSSALISAIFARDFAAKMEGLFSILQ